jgi:type I restriction enzyme S subunit
MRDRRWRTTELGEVANLKRGYDLPDRLRVAGPFPVVSSSGITGSHSVPKVFPPGVVTGRYGTLGDVYYLDEPYWPLNTTLYVENFKGNNARFVAYLLESLDLGALVASAAVPGVNRNHLHRLPVRVPEREDQDRIAAAIATFEKLIQNNRQRIGTLAELTRLIYREWFVHFRHPGLAEPNLIASVLGPIPTGWDVHPVSDIQASSPNATAAGPFGSKLGRKDYVDLPGVPVIRGANLRVGGGFDETDLIFVSAEKATELRTSIARPGDIVVTQRGTLGQVGLIPSSAVFPEYVLSQSQMKLTPDPARATALFVYIQLSEDSGTSRIQALTTGAGVPHINLSMFRELPLIVPPIQLQQQFTDAAEKLLMLADNLSRQNVALWAARHLLLPRLISGELDVSDRDLDLEPVA